MVLTLVLMIAVVSCGGAQTTTTITQSTWNPATQEGPPGRAHRLVIDASACWLGRVWRDAMREEEVTQPDTHCRMLLRQVYGEVNHDRLSRLRALDVVEVGELTDRIMMIAQMDATDGPRAPQLKRLLLSVATAEREQMEARRAAARIKMDISGEREHDRLSDERDAVLPLSEGRGIYDLLAYMEEPFQNEARAIGLLCAMDRMNMANGLPKHLKVYAVEQGFSAAFSVSPPDVPSDATVPMRAGLWLDYLTTSARAAGHPVPDAAQSLQDKEMLAWTGVMAGFADRLRNEAAHMPNETALPTAAVGAAERLDVEHREAESYVRAKMSH
jgi:hypothetical protein